MVAAEKDAKNKRRKSVGRDQPGRLRSEEREEAAVTEDDEELGRGELQINDPEDEKDARVPEEGIGLVDPELRDRGREQKEGEDKVARRLRLLTAKDKKGETGDEEDEDRDLHPGGVLEVAQHLV